MDATKTYRTGSEPSASGLRSARLTGGLLATLAFACVLIVPTVAHPVIAASPLFSDIHYPRPQNFGQPPSGAETFMKCEIGVRECMMTKCYVASATSHHETALCVDQCKSRYCYICRDVDDWTCMNDCNYNGGGEVCMLDCIKEKCQRM